MFSLSDHFVIASKMVIARRQNGTPALVYFPYEVRRAPIFAFEFENGLFEFAADKPPIEPLFALPPTCSSVLRLPYLLIKKVLPFQLPLRPRIR